jgi:hypothetical protein
MKAPWLRAVCVALCLVGWLSIPLAAQDQFGLVNVGSDNSITVTVTTLSAATLGSIAVSTQGAANLDFTNAGGGSCKVGTAYTAGATCTVLVSFAPKFAGPRYGAVVLNDNSGNVMGLSYLQGTGVSPQVNFLPSTESQLFPTPQAFYGFAVDGNGAVYLSDGTLGHVYKETPSAGGYTQSIIASGFADSYGLAVDGAGNVYVGDFNNGVVYKETLTASGYVKSTVATGLSWPNGLAVDGSGNLYIADSKNGRLLKETLSGGSYTESDILDCGIVGEQSCPSAVAVDANDNLYVVGYDQSQIIKLTPSGSSYTQSMIGSALDWPSDIVIDGAGNLYIAATLGDMIVKETLSEGSYSQSRVATSTLNWPWWVGVDGSGNLYISDIYITKVLKEDVSDPPSLSFAATPVGSISSDSPQTVTVINNGNAALDFSAVTFAADFPEASSGTGECTASTTLAAARTCTLLIEFKPVTPLSGTGPNLLSESVSIVTNTLNVTGTEQAIAVQGSEISNTPLTVSPAVLAFGNQGVNGTSAAKLVTLTSGNSANTISSMVISGPNGGDFAKSATTCGATLGAALSCTISITFTPTTFAAESATLTIIDSAPSSPQVITLTGTGVVQATTSVTTLVFRNEIVNVTSASQTVTLENGGNSAITLSGNTIMGANASAFAIAATTCGTSLAGHGSCAISVTFTPATVGAMTATLTIADSASTTPLTVSLTGAGVLPVSLTPAALAFGDQGIASTSAAKTVILRNNTNAGLTFSSIAISSASGDFAQSGSTCGTGIAANSFCLLSVTYRPSALGTETGTLTMTDNASNSPQIVSLSGIGVTQFRLSTTVLNFANHAEGTTSAAQVLTIANDASTTLSMGTISILGANPTNFAETGTTCGASLAGHKRCTVSFTFTPTAVSSYAATVTIKDAASNSPQTVTLEGKGVAAAN